MLSRFSIVATACLLLCATPVYSVKFRTQSDYAKARLDCFDYLKAYLAPRDVNLTDAWLYRMVDMALLPTTLPAMRWAKQVPWDIFLNDVLPYASVNEPRELWRRLMFDVVAPLVVNATTLAEAALLINKNMWDVWKPSVPWTLNPPVTSPVPTQVMNMMYEGYAMGQFVDPYAALGVFLVNALRSVGIPARIAGTYSFRIPQGSGLQWVEVWDGSAWSFTSPASWNPLGFNHTSFFPNPACHQIPGDHNYSIWATSWAPGDGYMPEMNPPPVPFIHVVDVTPNYLDAAAAVHSKGLPVPRGGQPCFNI